MYNKLGDAYLSVEDCELLSIAVFEKLAWVLSSRCLSIADFIPDTIIDDDGSLVDHTLHGKGCKYDWDRDSHELLTHSGFDECKAVDYATTYYAKSPYWYVSFDVYSIVDTPAYDEIREDDAIEDKERAFVKAWLDTVGGYGDCEYLIDDLIADGAGTDLISNFDINDQSCFMESLLYPLYAKWLLHAPQSVKSTELVSQAKRNIDSYYRVLSHWASGYSVSFLNDDGAFFLSLDGSSYFNEPGVIDYGALRFNMQIILAGKLMDDEILKLNESFHFCDAFLNEMKGRKGAA